MNDLNAGSRMARQEPAPTGKVVKAIFAASSGNLVEWYDFYSYSFFSGYFAEQFFTGVDQTGASVRTAAILFLGFLMGPIGGYLFGRMSDRYGRRHAMVTSILMMGFGSLGLAILPTAATIGDLAPILLVAMRCVQGISVGGEYGSTATYMSEIAHPGRRGFFSSFQYATLISGQLIASLLAFAMTRILGDDQIAAGWWRLPFILGAVASLISLWLRVGLPETISQHDRNRVGSGSFAEVLHYRRSFWIVFGISSAGSLTFYVFTTYMQKYLIGKSGFGESLVAGIMTACLLAFIVFQPLAGMISDRIGRRNALLIFATGMIALPVPLLMEIGTSRSPEVVGLLILLAMACLSFYTSISGIAKAEMFPTHVRGLGVAFTHAIGSALFGGSSEYVALFMQNHGMDGLFPWYLVVIAASGLVAVLFMHDDRHHSMLDNAKTSAYGR